MNCCKISSGRWTWPDQRNKMKFFKRCFRIISSFRAQLFSFVLLVAFFGSHLVFRVFLALFRSKLPFVQIFHLMFLRILAKESAQLYCLRWLLERTGYRRFLIKELDCRPAKQISSSVYCTAQLNTPVSFCRNTKSRLNSPSRGIQVCMKEGTNETPTILLLPEVRFRWRHLQNKPICFLTSLSVFLD